MQRCGIHRRRTRIISVFSVSPIRHSLVTLVLALSFHTTNLNLVLKHLSWSFYEEQFSVIILL